MVGEPQVLGQVKEAFGRSAEAGTVGKELSSVIARVLQVAKRVRTETAIGRAGVSWGHASADLAEKVLGPLEGRRAVVVGAGEMARLSAQHLHEQGMHVVVVNRTLANAEALAREVEGEARPIDALAEELVQADVAVVAAPVALEALEPRGAPALMKQRRHRRLLLLDLAVPRAVPAALGDVDGIYVCDVDDLARIQRQAQEARAGSHPRRRADHRRRGRALRPGARRAAGRADHRGGPQPRLRHRPRGGGADGSPPRRRPGAGEAARRPGRRHRLEAAPPAERPAAPGRAGRGGGATS